MSVWRVLLIWDLSPAVALPLMTRQNAFVALLSQNLAHNYETTELTK